MESRMHRSLKCAAAAFLREHGCRVVAAEVVCPFGRYRVDVAGYADRPVRLRAPSRALPPPREHDLSSVVHDHPGTEPSIRTVFIECKATRSDFGRDASARAPLEALKVHLEGVLTRLHHRAVTMPFAQAPSAPGPSRGAERDAREGRLPRHEDAAGSLFAGLVRAEEDLLRSRSYRSALRRLRKVEHQLHGATKFATLVRYRLADRMYIAAPEGVLRPRDLPEGWGLLEAAPRLLEEGNPGADLFGRSVLRVRVRATPLSSRAVNRARVLRNIAVAASAVAAREMGILA